MSEADLTIGPGTRVTLHFAILLPTGEEVDSTFSGKPATFEVGDGNLLPGFESALHGMRPGESATLTVEPEQAFGMPHPDNIQQLPRDTFAPDMVLEPGLVVSFADAARAEVPGVVVEFDEDVVTVDFNHPLAGRELRFDVNVIRVEPAPSR